MRIAVLALQGAFAEHRQKLAQLGVDSFEVRQLKDWDQPKDGLIIPGGESTTQAKLLNELGLMEPVKEAIAAGLPVYGTCAGLILLAKKIEGEPSQRIASMDITALNRKGLDEMANNAERGRTEITTALETGLKKAKENRPLSMLPQIWTDYKKDELANIYKGKGTQKEKEAVFEILTSINPSQNKYWDQIKE